MSLLLIALLVWLVGVPVAFWALATVYQPLLRWRLQRRVAAPRHLALVVPSRRAVGTPKKAG
jgi:hypothetical protein